jgi:hypothetical protein
LSDVERIGHPTGGTRAWRRLGAACVVLACATVGLLAAARPADASLLEPDGFQDRVIQGPVPAVRSASASLLRLAVPGGGSISVQVDAAYAGGGALQRVLNTLAELPHGPEMNGLTVRIADLGNLYRFCGQGATACYYPSSQTMIVSGSPINQNNGMPQGMVIAHEYGHHIEANRSLPGWNASDLGGRHWATYERVCEGVGAGRLFPGDQGEHYWDNPGEAFAQAYATMLYPDAVPWWWHFAEPDEGAFDAVRADVADSLGGTKVRWARRLAAGSARAATTVTTALDGPIGVRLLQPRAARFDLVLRGADGRILRRGRVMRRSKGKAKRPVSQLTYSSCGTRSFTVEVRRRAGKGRFAVQIQKP